MDFITKDELKTLTHQASGPFVSIYVPTRKAGQNTQKQRIRLKNLLNSTEEQLIEAGLRTPAAQKMLTPARKLLDNDRFWAYQNNGLAIFMATGFFQTYRLPMRFDELLVVADSFHLKPLMPLLSDDSQFFVLAISQNRVRLFQGTKYRLDEITLNGVPTSLSEALKYDDPQKHQQLHSASGGSGSIGKKAAIFHGHGAGNDDEQRNILRFCQHIDKGLKPILNNEAAPLILAGVDYLQSLYHKANSYNHLLKDGITGNPDELSAETLHQQAVAIIEPYFKQSKIEAMKTYRRLASTPQASHDIRKILPAAHYGQVDTLFVAVGQQQWGSFDPKTNTLQLHNNANAYNQDLLDVVAVETLLKDGTVFAVPRDKMPENSPLAAVFRY